MSKEDKDLYSKRYLNSIEVVSILTRWIDIYAANVTEAWSAFLKAGIKMNRDTEKMEALARRVKQIQKLSDEIDVILKYDFCDPNARKDVDKSIVSLHDILVDVIEHATRVNIDGTPKEDWNYLVKIPPHRLQNLKDWWIACQVGNENVEELEVF